MPWKAHFIALTYQLLNRFWHVLKMEFVQDTRIGQILGKGIYSTKFEHPDEEPKSER